MLDPQTMSRQQHKRASRFRTKPPTGVTSSPEPSTLVAVQAFSFDGQSKTIQTKDRSKEKSIGRVYLKELAFSDVKVVNEMYSCSGECFLRR